MAETATRELVMLASMELESSFKAILRANAYSGTRLSTNDYVKLADRSSPETTV